MVVILFLTKNLFVRVAVGVASILATYLIETHETRKEVKT